MGRKYLFNGSFLGGLADAVREVRYLPKFFFTHPADC